MYRGTTPSLVLKFPFDPSILTCLYVTFCQNGTTCLEKPIEACSISSEAKTVTICLTQAETLQLEANKDVQFQVRAKTKDGTVVASNIIRTSVGSILKEGEI